MFLGVGVHPLDSLLAGQAAELPRVLEATVVGERMLNVGFGSELTVCGPDHRGNRYAVLATEFEVALVVSRYSHDRARAVAHHHEIADPDGH